MNSSEQELQLAIKELADAAASQHFDPETLDYSIVDRYKSLLVGLEAIDGNYHELMDLHRMQKAIHSQRLLQHLGYATPEEADANVYREDALRMYSIGSLYLRYGLTLAPEVRKHYKLSTDYRIRTAHGTTIRLTEQHIAVELDSKGNIWLSLSSITISPDGDSTAPIKYRLTNVTTGETLILADAEKRLVPSPISERELKVLLLISQGKSSKQIADVLYISTNTVNTHRQRIIEKLSVANTTQAISKMQQMGLW